jgi:hypothetical protein
LRTVRPTLEGFSVAPMMATLRGWKIGASEARALIVGLVDSCSGADVCVNTDMIKIASLQSLF